MRNNIAFDLDGVLWDFIPIVEELMEEDGIIIKRPRKCFNKSDQHN